MLSKNNIFILPPMTREALNSLPFGAYVVNQNGVIEFFNMEMAKISGVADPREIEGQNVFKLPTYKKYGLVDYFKKGLAGRSFKIEGIKYVSYVGKKESIRSYYGIPIKDKAGKVTKLLCLAEDITEKKRNEQKIKDGLKERDMLLRELHHRIKNNMQIIYSLFNLQSLNIKDGQAKELLEESKGQIKSILMIHERLYQSKNITKINFKDYVKELVDDLFNLYRVDRSRVLGNFKTEDVLLGVDIAIPIALIINELVSNALKYAFPNKRKGRINIGLMAVDRVNYELTVGDNGIGDSGKNKQTPKEDKLGLLLVDALVKQIYGKITKIINQGGTKFIINFPIKI